MFNPYSVLNWKLFWWLFDWVNTVPLERFCMFSPLSFSGDYPVEWARFRLSDFVCYDLLKLFWWLSGWVNTFPLELFCMFRPFKAFLVGQTQSRLNNFRCCARIHSLKLLYFRSTSLNTVTVERFSWYIIFL